MIDGEPTGLNSLTHFLANVRKQKAKYQEGLGLAVEFVHRQKGKVNYQQGGEVELTVGEDTAICFQPYSDIDLFYYES